MSLLEDIARLNEGLTPEDLLKLDEKRGIAEQSERWQRINSGQPSHSGELAGGPRMSGKGSWYSQLPQHGWVDREDRPGSNALGVKDEEQGIALPSRKTLGQWFDVTFPNGETHRLQQTDVGPAPWTGKGIDISAAAAHKAGFNPNNFPTGGGFTWSPAEGPGGGKPPEETAATFDPTGRKRMANGDQQGILPLLGMQNQQPQGLLGALGDPETMSYIAMMLKGFNPYSNLDPNSMLSSAHTNALRRQALMQQQAERATDNTRADRALNLREQEYGLQREDRQSRDAALFEERQQKRDLAAKQKEIDDEVRRNMGGRMPGAPEEGAAPFAPEGTRSPEDQIAQLNAELAKNPSAPIAKSIERRIELLQKGPPASTIKSIEKAENEIAPLQATKDKLERMQALLPGTLEGPLAGVAGSIGGRAGYFGSQQAKDTLEFNNLAAIETVRDMSRTMKGSTAVKEMDVWLTRAADPTLPKQVRQNNLNMAIDAVNREIAVRSDRVKQLQEGTYGRKQAPKTEAPSEGGGALPGGWTVREK